MNKNLALWQISAADLSLINLALAEDLGCPYKDVTCEALFLGHENKRIARIISKHPTSITICGLTIVNPIIEQIDPNCSVFSEFMDGQILHPGQTLLHVEGTASSLLMVERTLLNFLRHLCAIATLTAKFVEVVSNTSLKILDTRKTTPGMRHLEKYAVQCGGGVNHRMGLYDAIMIKDTHIDLMGNMSHLFNQLPLIQDNPLPVIVEVRDKIELENVIKYGKNKVSRILLDNMSVSLLAECVALCKQFQLETEASGNINLSTIKDIASTGVDYASVGMLTHSAGQVDLTMKSVKN